MVGYDPKRDWVSGHKTSTTSTGHHLFNPKMHSAIAGFGSGCITRFLCHPLDVLKIRFQLQIEPISRISKHSKYKTISQTFACIIREEKFGALWKGHVSAQILSAIYGMVYFSSFDLFTKTSYQWLMMHEEYISHDAVLRTQPAVNFACGSLSGLLSTTLSHPFDVVRTRMVSQSEPKTYRNFRHAFTSLWQKEALKGFFRGYLPTVTQIMPYSGAQLASYNFFKQWWMTTFECDHLSYPCGHDRELRLQSSIVCGAASGIFAKFTTYPLDLIKKRLQIRGFEQARGTGFGKVPYYNGFIHCVVYTFHNESLAAFYKGLYPSLMKAMLTTALNFWLYESMMHALKTTMVDD